MFCTLRHVLDNDLMTTTEVAAFFEVHPKTVRGWIAAGHLPALRTPTTSGRGRIRVRRSAVEAFLVDAATVDGAA